MNVLILIPWINGDEIKGLLQKIYKLCSTCRMDLIQRALERGGSQHSNARFRDAFGLFFASLEGFEVGKSHGF